MRGERVAGVLPFGRTVRYPPPMEWDMAVRTDRGLRRARNEDTPLARPDLQLFAVADGMGGHAGGDRASQTAIATLAASFGAGSGDCGSREVATRLRAAFAAANQAILVAAEEDPANHGMGTTLTALCALPDDTTVIGHVGDSRAYRLRDGALEQLTTDHTWVQQQVDEGQLTEAQARDHPYSSMLTRVLGQEDYEAADIVMADARPRDRFLLCSDGLSGMMDDEAIRSILAQPLPAADVADQLVDAANERGGFDNITVIVLVDG